MVSIGVTQDPGVHSASHPGRGSRRSHGPAASKGESCRAPSKPNGSSCSPLYPANSVRVAALASTGNPTSGRTGLIAVDPTSAPDSPMVRTAIHEICGGTSTATISVGWQANIETIPTEIETRLPVRVVAAVMTPPDGHSRR